MIKRSLYIVIICIFMMTLISCGSDGGDDKNTDLYSNSYLPNKYGVVIPDSLQSSQAASYRSVKSAGNSMAYWQLYMEVAIVKSFFAEFEIEFMMLDAAYEDIMAALGNASGTVPAGTITITFTKEMKNKFEELYEIEDIGERSFLTKSDDDDYMPGVGDELEVPPLEVTLDPNDTDADGYNFVFKYTQSDDIYGDCTTTIKWNTAKTKLYLARAGEYDDGGITEIFSYKLIFDDTTDVMSLSMSSAGHEMNAFSSTINMKESGGANNEIYVDETITIDVQGTPQKMTLVGRADNTGGVVELDSMYRESFDGNGQVTGQSQWDGVAWVSTGVYGSGVDEDCSVYAVELTGFSLDATDITNLEGVGGTTDPFCFVVVPEGTSTADVNVFIGQMVGFALFDPTADVVLDSSYWGSGTGELSAANIDVYIESYNSGTGEFEYTAVADVTPTVVVP